MISIGVVEMFLPVYAHPGSSWVSLLIRYLEEHAGNFLLHTSNLFTIILVAITVSLMMLEW